MHKRFKNEQKINFKDLYKRNCNRTKEKKKRFWTKEKILKYKSFIYTYESRLNTKDQIV